MKNEIENKIDQATHTTLSRRTLLKWSAPVVTAVAIPTHAQASNHPDPKQDCGGAEPTLVAQYPAKCSGSPLTGQGKVQITSDDNNTDIVIKKITYTGASSTDIITLPTLPVTVSTTNSAEIRWVGQGSDAQTCLPLSSIIITVEYACPTSPVETKLFELTEIFQDALEQ